MLGPSSVGVRISTKNAEPSWKRSAIVGRVLRVGTGSGSVARSRRTCCLHRDRSLDMRRHPCPGRAEFSPCDPSNVTFYEPHRRDTCLGRMGPWLEEQTFEIRR